MWTAGPCALHGGGGHTPPHTRRHVQGCRVGRVPHGMVVAVGHPSRLSGSVFVTAQTRGYARHVRGPSPSATLVTHSVWLPSRST